MSDKKAPRPKVEVVDVDDPEGSYEQSDDPAGSGRARGATDPGAAPGADAGPDFVRDSTNKVADWVSRTFPGNENAFWGAVVGLVAAIMLFVIGVGRLLAIAIFVVCGIAVGQALDGDPKIARAVQRLVNRFRRRDR